MLYMFYYDYIINESGELDKRLQQRKKWLEVEKLVTHYFYSIRVIINSLGQGSVHQS